MLANKVLLFLTLICSAHLASGDPVFHQQDEKGRYIYTNRDTQGTPAKLPKLARYDSSKVVINVPESCGKHGGVDCRRGGDTDGSVICKDDFRNVDLMFLDACVETRLELLSLSGPDSEGVYEVHLRNLRDLEAIAPSVRLFFSPSKPLELESQPNVKAYSTIRIKFKLDSPKLDSKLESKDLWITCENCE